MAAGRVFRFFNVVLDLDRQRLLRGSIPLHLRPKAWALLCNLVARPGELATTEDLLGRLWPDKAVEPQALTRLVFELRQLLDEDGRTSIQTVARRGYRFVAPVTADVAEPDAAAPLRLFVGRQVELEGLERHWRRSLGGARQIVFVAAEAGIGKTALIDEFLSSASGALIARGGCRQQRGEREAYGVVLDAVARLANQLDLVALLRRVAPTVLAQLPWLTSEEEGSALRADLAAGAAGRVLRETAQLLEAIAAEAPLIVVLEDLHWSDDATVDLLGTLAGRWEPARMLILASYRPVEVAVREHPLGEAIRHLANRSKGVSRLVVPPLSGGDVASYVKARFGSDPLPAQLCGGLERKSGGNPLFLHVLTDYLVGERWIVRDGSAWTMTRPVADLESTLPESLREILAEQLSHASPDEHEALEALSVRSEDLTAQEVAAALAIDEVQAERCCSALVRRGHFLRTTGEQGGPAAGAASFGFSHVLYKQVIDQAVAPLRRCALNARLGEHLETVHGEHVVALAPRLAALFADAGNYEKELLYSELSALRDVQRVAFREAMEWLERCLLALGHLPAGPARDAREAARRLDYGNLVVGVHGVADPRVARSFEEAFELATSGGDFRVRFRAQMGRCMAGLLTAANGVANLEQAMERANWLIAEAGAHDPSLVAVAHFHAQAVCLGRGAFAESAGHHRLAMAALAVAAAGIPVGLHLESMIEGLHAYGAGAQGEIERAREASRRAEKSVAGAATPRERATSLSWLASAALCRRDDDDASRLAERAVLEAEACGLENWAALARGVRACARLTGNAAAAYELDGTMHLRSALGEQWQARTFCLHLAAHWRGLGDIPAAAEWLEKAAAIVDPIFEAELWRERAELVAVRADLPGDVRDAEVEHCFAQALAVSRSQEARLFELRATVGFARHVAAKGGETEARELVGGVLASMPPAESADCIEARQLLARLS